MLVDETGYVWAGTLDGLNRYNGYSFDVFRPHENQKNTVSGGIITSLCKGAGNDIWAVSRNGGLNRYNAALKTIELIADSLLPGINSTGISNMCYANAMLWVQNQGHVGVYHTKMQTFNLTFFKEVPNGIHCYSDSSILIFGSFGIRELIYSQGHFSSRVIYEKEVFLLHIDKKIIALTQEGLLQWDLKFNKLNTILNASHFENENLKPSEAQALISSQNEIWLGGPFPLIRINFNGDVPNIERYSYDREKRFSLKGYVVTQLQKDKAGNIWIGTEKHGLNLYDRAKNRFNHQDLVFEDLSNRYMDPVRAICKTSNGNLWVGFDQKGVGQVGRDGTKKIYLKYYKPDNTSYDIGGVRHIFEDSNGDIWISELSNLCIFNKQKDRIETVDCRYEWTWPYRGYVVKEFEKGLLTISGGINLGIVNLANGNLTLLPTSRNGVGIRGIIRDMTYDRYQNLYLAMDNASVLKIDYPNLNYSDITPANNGLSDAKVYAFATRNDTLWIATNTGLNLFDIKKNKVTDVYYESDGLSNNVIYSVHLHKNTLWYSSNRGFGKMDLGNKQFETFLPDDYFMDDAFYFDPNGDILYGGYTGIVSFNPENIPSESTSNVPYIESFHLLDQEIHPGDTIGNQVLMHRAFNGQDTIILSHLQNTFSLSLNGFPIKASGSHDFRYRLLNLHKDWIYASAGNRIASYNKISPGNYIFQAEVKQEKNQWSAPVELSIRIIPPFWQQNWFRFLFVLIIAFLMAFVYQLRVQQIRKRNALLKRTVEEQTAELRIQNQQIKTISDKLHEADQSRLRFFTNISHEFRTPLTLILGQIELMKNVGDTKAMRGIRNSALHLLRLVNQLIDFRKMELGQTKLVVEKFDLIQFIDAIVQSFQVLATKKQITLSFQHAEKQMFVWLDKEKMEKIIYNLISNAIKYTPDENSITIHCWDTKNDICIDVSDTGIGIAQNELKHIFDRFFRAEVDSNNAGGHGIGLTLVKGLTEMQKGTISVSSKPGEGTSFTLTFKKGNKHFKPENIGKQTSEPIQINEPIQDAHHALVTTGASILIVEDNEELSTFLQNLLGDHFQLIVAHNGSEALEKLKTHLPELIISDIMMPIMDGMVFCRKIKSNDETSHIPFILLTAKSDIESQMKGFEMGIDAYIEKPFIPQLLFAQINALLENREKLRQKLFAKPKPHSTEAISLSKQDKQLWDKICIHINASYSNSDFNTEQLAEQLAMGRATLHRKFKSLTGISPGEYIRKTRLKKACEHLDNSSMTVAQISDDVGFQSVAHFRKAFKDCYGKTPREYRNT